MSAKTGLLQLLEESNGSYVSGETIAANLSVSRNAVWKAIKALRAEGYEIDGATNRGYRLSSRGNSITQAGIYSNMKNEGFFSIDIRKSVTSTNTILRELAVKGAPEGYVVVAEEQTAGKGRMGRSFFSPPLHGVYFSLLLKPEIGNPDVSLITSAAAVAAARAIEDIFNRKVGIKWVNDLYLDEKKICGILTESTFSMESGMIENAVLGIGINVTKPSGGFPSELKGSITAVMGNDPCSDGERCRLIASVLDEFLGFYNELSARKFLSEYRARSILLGRDIYVMSSGGKRSARALDIDDQCRLIIRYENGETEALGWGEVSVKLSG